MSEGGEEGSVLPQHDVDDERVSHQAADADQSVENLYDGHHVCRRTSSSVTRQRQHTPAVTLQLRHILQLREVTEGEVEVSRVVLRLLSYAKLGGHVRGV